MRGRRGRGELGGFDAVVGKVGVGKAGSPGRAAACLGGGGGSGSDALTGSKLSKGGGAGSAFEKRDRPGVLGVWRDDSIVSAECGPDCYKVGRRWDDEILRTPNRPVDWPGPRHRRSDTGGDGV